MSATAFLDPVLQSQAAFRAVLKAMSRPGFLVTTGADLVPPAPLQPAAAAALLTLADYETPLWLPPRWHGGEADRWLRFHTGAPAAARPRDAAFAFLDLAEDELRLEDFALGAPEYPDRSTTLVLACASISSDGPLELSGPGVNGAQRFGFAPFPGDFLAQWQANVARFPLGVDLILTHATSLAALPRTARIVGGA
jgi:alpha-D-ribose 1-methylphosphonate 5-triphosphate synthase subunit PhnH